MRGLRARIFVWWQLRAFRRSVPRKLQVSPALGLIGLSGDKSVRPLLDNQGEVRTRIRQMADNGALDEGCGDVLDRLIDTWTERCMHEIEQKYLARQTVIEELLLQARDRRAAAKLPSRKLAEQRRNDVRALRRAHQQLLGTDVLDDGEAFGYSVRDGERRERRA